MSTPRGEAARPAPVVGLVREREVLTVALEQGRHVVIEGPPGTGKSTLLRSVARDAGRGVVFVEGNAELTPARLLGQHDPAQVLTDGYTPESFVDGPLLASMRRGELLYLEELNRVPEETLNVLITVLAEGEVAVPRLGTVAAAGEFRLIAAMNPFDAIGTARVSQAIADRMCRVVLDYQDEEAERRITSSSTGVAGPELELGVALTRATREHPDLRMGASVRGAIDMTLLVTGLGKLREEGRASRATTRDAALAALSGRVRVADGSDRTPESVLDELLDRLWPPTWEAEEAADSSVGGSADDPAGDPDGEPPGDLPGDSPGDGAGFRETDREAEGEAAQATAREPGHATGQEAGQQAGPGAAPAEDGSGKAERPASGGPGGGRGGVSRPRRRRPDPGLRGGGGRSESRHELAARHAAFQDVSPQLGELDEAAFERALAADPDRAAALLCDLAAATDRDLRAAARRLAGRVFVRLGRSAGPHRRGARALGPRRGADGDLDLDRTLSRWSGNWPPDRSELVTRHWSADRRALCLAVDASGSMRGQAVALAAIAASGVTYAAEGDTDPSVLAFAGDTSVLARQGQRRPAAELVGDLIRLRGHGGTDLAGALRRCAIELAGIPASERVVVLLSDCVHTLGDDPATALAGIDRLHVLCPSVDGQARQAASALAARGAGDWQPVTGLAAVGPALARLLGQ